MRRNSFGQGAGRVEAELLGGSVYIVRDRDGEVKCAARMMWLVILID
jgi:hypothetical protein